MEPFCNTLVSEPNFCDCKDSYWLVMFDITVVAAGDRQVTLVAFKNWVPFTNCITKIDVTRIDYTEDLNLVMLVYNLL